MAKVETKKKATKKVKRPTAQKRMLQNNKRRLQNRTTRSEVRTAIRRLNESIEGGQPEVVKEKLNKVYSLLDKGVKSGVYKANSCSRQKSRLTVKAAKVIA